ncbi:MAG TPA: CDP-diacylglycerol--glycerol-3-phosphate 3-phosphatidyltransferase [Chthoniobacterales bacterium]
MNWANRLTLGRLVLTVFFVLSLSSAWAHGRTIALLLFAVAGITDYFDGEIARRYGFVTNFGKLMDPLVDKVMMAAAFICLVPLGAVPAWVATIVVARDFLITGLRLIASSDGVILPAEKLGKHKTSWQIATVVYFLVLLAAHELGLVAPGATWWHQAWHYGGDLLLWITIGLTIYSGLGYLWRHRGLIKG